MLEAVLPCCLLPGYKAMLPVRRCCGDSSFSTIKIDGTTPSNFHRSIPATSYTESCIYLKLAATASPRYQWFSPTSHLQLSQVGAQLKHFFVGISCIWATTFWICWPLLPANHPAKWKLQRLKFEKASALMSGRGLLSVSRFADFSALIHVHYMSASCCSNRISS